MMTVLSAQTIEYYALEHEMIDPFVKRAVCRGRSYGLSSNGYDLRVGKFLDEEGVPHEYGVVLEPGECLLASSLERFKIPKDLCGIIHDKSTWARQFVTVQNTVAEACWEGWLTLEIINHSKGCVRLDVGDPIAQMIFHKLDQPTNQPYSGKYQNQENQPVPARFEK